MVCFLIVNVKVHIPRLCSAFVHSLHAITARVHVEGLYVCVSVYRLLFVCIDL